MKKLVLLILILVFTATSVVLAGPSELAMSVGESEILTIKNVVRISTSIPEVVEIVVAGGQDILLNAKKPGLSVINIWTSQGVVSYRVTVQDNYAAIEKEISKLINNPRIKVIVNQKFVILNGEVDNSIIADKAVQYAKMYREQVVNNLKVKTKYQILLSIMVTEIKKEFSDKYGFRWGSWVQTTNGVLFYDWQWGFVENPNGHIAHYPGNWGIGTMLDAMQKDGNAKVLAAPSILTTSGKEASFLAGGEIPIPLADGQGGTKVEWKEYGIKLKVVASITEDALVTLDIAPEVSTLDWANAILVGGDKLPALASRKVSTNLLFKEGSTLVIGGLLKREDSQNIFKLPILGDLPIVGPLFRSKEFQKGDTELLFFVTPKIIKDGSGVDPAALTKPADQGPHFQEEKTPAPKRK